MLSTILVSILVLTIATDVLNIISNKLTRESNRIVIEGNARIEKQLSKDNIILKSILENA